ncbi:hypothetical protein BDN70DRAFT_885371 [Pholiota conissans]|uniref:Uncharacterized protein n=1 Tax=Pholiota conissans TaxID=109636 RepID=A0A9P5YR63_9AGAR|nr:hypothetical protein BDN70DRAFT_885371 [Pholiota conissans]
MYSRAGLFSFILAFLIASVAAAPIPDNNAQNVASHGSLGTSISNRIPSTAFSVNQIRAGQDVFAPVTSNSDTSVHRREVDDLERRNFFKKMKHAFKKVGRPFKKVAKFVKANGPKIAKVGLKVAAAATKVGSKFAGYIPGVGKVASMAMTRASALANSASNRIHANIGGKLEKAMKGIDKAEHYADYIPREMSKEDYLLERAFDDSFDDFDARDAYEWESLMEARGIQDEWLYKRDTELTY